MAIVVCILIIPKIWNFLFVILIGLVISLLANPIVKFLERKLKIKKSTGSAMVILLVIAAIVLLLFAGITSLVKEGIKLISCLPALFQNAEQMFNELESSLSFLQGYLPKKMQTANFEIMESIKSLIAALITELKDPAIAAVGNVALSLPTILVSIVMCVLFAYYNVTDEGKMLRKLYNLIPEAIKKKLSILKKVFVDAIGGYFKAQLKIEGWIFLLLLAGFLILDVESPGVIAFVTAFADILPVLGTGTILLPWAVIEFFNHDLFVAIGLFIVWIATLIIRQIIQPKIVSDSVGLSPIPTVVLLLAGYQVAGFAGMIFSVPIGIIVLELYKAGMFDTTINSCLILYNGLEKFRYFTKEEIDRIKNK